MGFWQGFSFKRLWSRPLSWHIAFVLCITGYDCHCDPSWDGKQCENLVKKCAAFPCLNGASCTDVGEDFYCTCTTGMSDFYCTCTTGMLDFYCTCTTGM